MMKWDRRTSPAHPIMTHTIRFAQPADIAALQARDFAFQIDAVLPGPFDVPVPTLDGVAVPPRRKAYTFDAHALTDALHDPDADVLVIERAARQPFGYLLLSCAWNGYASIDDLAVDATHRRQGAAAALMDVAADWARGRQLAGLRLETQSNNVAACRFYARQGFMLGGSDRFLYSALHPDTDEVALYWYLRF